MRKIRKSTSCSHRVFAAVLAAALLFTMPGMASYAEVEAAQTEDISESATVLAEYDAAEETEAENEVIQEPETEDSDTDKLETREDDAGDADAQKPAEKEAAPTLKEDVKECTCGTLCTQDSINEDCPVCGAEDADLSCCVGEKTENRSEENKEDAEQGDTGAQDAGTNLCAHHKEHTQDCGYSLASEDGEGSPCTYECRICPIEDLIATLPGEVTEDNAKEVRALLNKILALYRELTAEEQEQIDISRCLEQQEALDAANIPAPIDESTEGLVAQVAEGDGTAENPWHCGDNVTATLEDGTLTIRGTGNMANFGNFTSPPWEADKNTITRVVIEPGVTSIGKMAFSGHRALQSVEIPTGVTEIGFNAFNYCTALQSVTIPGSVKTIGESAFSCSGLTEVTIPEGVTLIDFSAFQQCGSLTKVAIPASVTKIEQQAFCGCSRLTEVAFAGQTAPTLGDMAFDDPSGRFPVIPGSTLIIIVPTGAVGYTAENGWPIVAQVETAGGTICYGDFTTAWAAAKSAGTATITLLADVTASDTLTVDAGSTITLTGGDYTLTSGQQTAIQVSGTLKLESGTVKSTCSSSQAKGINVSGTLEMTGGAVTTSENIVSGSMAVRADSGGTITVSGGKISGVYGIPVNGGTVTIQNGEISGRRTALDINIGTVTIEGGTFIGRVYGLNVGQNGTAVLRGGAFTGGDGGCAINSKTPLSGLLDQTQPSTYYAYFENGKPVALEDGQTSLDGGTFTVGECNHEGGVRDNGDGTHGGKCPYCGAELAAAPHTLGDGNKCEGCGATLVAQVQTSDGTIVYLGEGDFANAFDDRKYNNVTVTLLSDIQADSIEMGDTQASVHVLNTSTLDLAGHTITSSDTAIYVYPTGNLTIQDSSPSKTGQVVSISSAAILTQTGMVSLTGGTYTGIPTIDGKASSTNVSSLLANYGTQGTPHYAYFNAQGNPIALGENQRELTGTVTVGECKHEGIKATPNNDGTHSLKCLYCGYTAAENCSYGTEYQHDDTNHWKTCTVCQGTTTPEAHYLRVTADEPVNGVTKNYEKCDDCDYTRNPFTVTVTVPSGLTYGSTVGIKPSFTISTEKTYDTVQLVLEDGEGTKKWLTGDTLPNDISAGTYKLYLTGGLSDNPMPVFLGRAYFTVSPATLTGDMVTLSSESVTYSGAEQKPTITVKQGETTLAPGTNYDVTYSTSDFINAGTITVTITGKGNYTGTVETTYTIKKAPLTITASDQTITYGGSITQGADNVTVAGLCTGDVLESITLTASTANVPGGNITPSAAGIKNSGGRDVTGNYEITYEDGGLTINKADAEITVGTDTYNKTFGDAAFTLDVTDNNTEADVQYEVTAGADVISVSNGTVTVRNAGTATITVSLPETANYNAAASRTITVTVAKKGGYTVTEQNRSYLYSRVNTGSIDLATLLPKDCGAVTYGTPAASGDVTYSAVPALNNGILSYTLNSGEINDKGTITVTVATRNYADIMVTVKVKLTDRIPVSPKTGTEVTLEDNALIFGEPLSKLVFNEAEFVGDDGSTVAGTLAWKDAAATPNAGTTSAVWVFIPADTVYMSVEGMAAIRVNQATPTVSRTLALTERVYNPSIPLEDDDLSSVTVTGVDGKALEGKWSWESANIIPTVDNSGYDAVFTPKDTTNYETVIRTITVNVTKATPYIAGLPAAAAITYGGTLKDSLLSGGIVQYGSGTGQAGDKAESTEPVAGAFTWKEPSAKPVVADSNLTEYTIVFTPSDTADYNPVEAKVRLTVNKAQNAPNMPGSAMSVSNSIEKVGSVPLPTGWEWQVKDTALEVGMAVSAVAVYTGADKGNYENETVTVSVTRSSCDHVAGDVLYTGEGEKAPTCTEDGLGHKECTVCGAVMESGIVAKALGHTGGTATCSQKAVCTRCNQPYGDTDSNIHGGTEVRGFVAATCTAGGYTGDTYCKDCGARTKTGSATAALGHNYTSKATTEATTDREGIRTYTCSRCGHSYTRPIAKLPGDGTTKPGSGQPGDTEPGTGNTEETRPEPGIPFIKGEDSKTGWDVIRAEEEQAKEGSVNNVDMNGITVVPGDIFDCIRGRDITITFDMGGGIIWSVDGKSVTADRTGDIDFSVKTGVNAIPVDIVNNVTGERYSIQINLAHEGEFGFTAVLSINLGKENAGYTASLYYYNQSTGELEFICADEVAEDGTASLAFTHASDYVIAIDGDEEESGITEPVQPQGTEGTDGNNTAAEESPKTGQGHIVAYIIALIAVAIAGIAVFVWRKKEEKEGNGDCPGE